MVDTADLASSAVEGLTEYALEKHRSRQKNSNISHLNCVSCGAVIPEARRKAVKGVQLCIDCQEEIEDDIIA